MPSNKIYLPVLISGLLIFQCRVFGQHPVNPVGPTDFATVKKTVDSLSFFIEAGKVYDAQSPCLLPEHYAYYLDRPGFTLNFSKEALHLGEEKKVAFTRMQLLLWKSADNFALKNYTIADSCLQQALEISLANHFYFEEIHKIRPSLNNSCFLSGDYAGAMKISTAGLVQAEKLKDAERMGQFNNVIGYIHMKQKNFKESSHYFAISLQQFHEIKDSLNEAHALFNLADLAMAQQEYDSAIEFLQQSLTAYRAVKDPVISKRITLAEREANIFNKMAETYKLKGDFRQALPLSKAAIKDVKEHDAVINDFDKAGFYVNGGDIYNHLQLPDSAVFYLDIGLQIAHRIVHREYIRDSYEQLAIAYAQKKKFDSAYHFQKLYASLKDSISTETSQREIFQREAALQIERQRQVQQTALAKQRTWRNIIIGVSLFLLFTLAFLYNRYRLTQKNKYQQELNRQQNELFNALASAQDQERKRIAQDIHDSLGSILSAAKLKLSALKESHSSLSADQSENYITTLTLLDEASAELRSISHNIMPATLSKLGLIAALKNLSTTISSHSGLQIDFSAHDFNERINEQTEMSIYRIVLELINNVVKHAQANKVTVQLIRYPDYINLSVEDNGRGFDYMHALKEKKGIGLGNILSRVDFLKGRMNVDALAGRGTAIIIEVPTDRESG